MNTVLEDAVRARVLGEPAGDVVRQVTDHARGLAPLLGEAAIGSVVDRVVARVRGLGALEPLLADPDVSEVMVNGGRDVWVERHGRLEPAGVRLAPGEAEHLIERVVGPLGRRVDRSSPIVDARLPDGSRVHAIVPPLAVDGPCLTIRRFAARAVPLAAFCPPGVEGLLRWAIAAGANVLVSGATSSGNPTVQLDTPWTSRRRPSPAGTGPGFSYSSGSLAPGSASEVASISPRSHAKRRL